MLASFHNTLNSVDAIPQGIVVTTNSGGPLRAGVSNGLTLSSGSAGVPLDGVLAYARDPAGTPQGTFTDNGGMNIFIPFAGCGLNPQGQINGVIQQMVISENVCRRIISVAHQYLATVQNLTRAHRKLTPASPTTCLLASPAGISH